MWSWNEMKVSEIIPKLWDLMKNPDYDIKILAGMAYGLSSTMNGEMEMGECDFDAMIIHAIRSD
jgi:hypothetical protein